MKIDVRKEMERRKSVQARMLRAFKEKGELTTRELITFGPGCSSRLFELRKDGHDIQAIYEKPGLYRYKYKGKKAVKQEEAKVETGALFADMDNNEPFIPPRRKRSFLGLFRTEVQE